MTVAQFVPSLLEVFLQHPGHADCRSLRRVFCGGEPLTRELCQHLRSCLTADLVNLYGPTETAIDTVFRLCDPNDPAAASSIGRPVANTQVYVLDPHQQLVPIGVPGELYIGGVQVARGYLNRPRADGREVRLTICSATILMRDCIGRGTWFAGEPMERWIFWDDSTTR